MNPLSSFCEAWQLSTKNTSAHSFLSSRGDEWATIIQGARGRSLTDDERKKLTQLLAYNGDLIPQLHGSHRFVETAFGLADERELRQAADSLRQINHQLSAQILALLTADQLRRIDNKSYAVSDWLTETIDDVPGMATNADLLTQSAHHLAISWPELRGDSFDGPIDAAPAEGSSFGQVEPFDLAVAKVLAGQPAPIWLAVRRMIAHFLQPMNRFLAPADGRQAVYPLLASPAGQRLVSHVDVSLVAEGRFGYFIDPIALGLVALDRSFQQSLQLVWKLARAKLRQRWEQALKEGKQGPLPAICLQPRLPVGLLCIEGESASGLLACALLASASGERLDSHATSSVWLAPNNPECWNRDDLTESDIELRDVALPQTKVDALTDAVLPDGGRLRAVVLTSRQADLVTAPSDIDVHGASSFHGLYQLLVKGARCEAVLKDYSRQVAARWRPRRRGESRDVSIDRPSHYVAPHYGILKKGRSPSDRYQEAMREPSTEKRESPYEPIAAKATDRDAELRELLVHGGQRLCVTEDAGAGKTVFGKRVRAYLSSTSGQSAFLNNKPGLAVHWESRDPAWPASVTELERRLAESVSAACTRVGRGVKAADVVEFALRNRRVTIVLDALDQVLWEGHDRDRRLDELWSYFQHDEQGQSIRLIVTGRAFAVADDGDRFPRRSWRFATIFGFDDGQLDIFFRGLYHDSAKDLFPQFDLIEDLIRVPVLAAMARDMAIKQRRQFGQQHIVRLTELGTRGAFYREAHRVLEGRAKKQGLHITPQKSRRYLEILATTAFTFMVWKRYGYLVVGSEQVANVQDEASSRLAQRIDESEWIDLAKFSQLSDHRILEGVAQDVLSWRHKGWMEYFCGLYLARFARPQDLADIADLADDANWYWAWRFAIEMVNDSRRDRTPIVLGRALQMLFQRPKSGRRPTELMYRAWHLVDHEGDGLVLREQGYVDANEMPLSGDALARAAQATVLPNTEWMGQTFLSELRGFIESGNRIAVTLVPEPVLIARGQLTPDEADARSDAERHFARCPRSGDHLSFEMGSDRGGDESPKHSVEFPAPFWMASTQVTRAQFSLFDHAWLPEHREEIEKRAQHDDCPAIMVTWYDAFCFAKWCRCRLPTEAEWEFACRAGTSTVFAVGPTITEDLANFGQDWETGCTTAVRTYPPNAWGMYDMHGNVWEWTGDWYDGGYYRSSPRFAPPGPVSGVFRVFRGGSWDDSAGNCRSAYRDWDGPELRCGFLGFRLAWVPSSQQLLAAEPQMGRGHE